MMWCGKRCSLVEFLLKNGESFVRAPCAFKQKFQLKQHDCVPSCLSMSRWLAFCKTGAVTNICCHANERMGRTPKNAEHVRA